MDNEQKKLGGITLAAVGLLILIGAYFLFQGNSALPNPGVGSTTGTILAATTTANGGQVIVSSAQGGNGDFGARADVTGLTLGATIPPIAVNLPADTHGKYIVVALLPAGSASSVATEVLLAIALNTTETTYRIAGLTLEHYTDGKTGQKGIAIPPGTYQLQTVLWDKNPFNTDGTYPNFVGNNATAVISSPFTL